MKEYKQYIKKNFKPKTLQYQSLDPPKTLQRANNSHRQVRRYRYYKGQAFGEVKEDLPMPKSDAEKKRIGDGYL